MKKWFILPLILLVSLVSYTGCTEYNNSRIYVENKASEPVFINFRGDEYPVNAAQTIVINDIPKGSFDYSTTYQIPPEATSTSADGAVAGTIQIVRSGAVVRIIYASVFTNDGGYTLSATYSTNQENSTLTVTGP
jgi:hypothetical protein